jgi:hypothetical protein
MAVAAGAAGVPYPLFSADELVNVVAFLRSVAR